jgi:hypothetical protein
MAGWVTLFTAVFSFGTQVFKYLREQEEADKECATKLRKAKNAIKKARQTKDTSDIEDAFIDLGFAQPK